MAEQLEVNTQEVPATPEPLTWEKLAVMSGSDMKALRDTPEGRETVDKVIADHYASKAAPVEPEALPQTPEEKEAETVAAEKAAKEAEEKAVEKLAADQAEAEKKAAEEKARLIAEEAAKPKQKFVIDFQATDDRGEPIGSRTHLEADTQEELQEKMKASYINAVRYAERMKRRAELKPTPAPVEKVIPILSDKDRTAAQKDLESQDATVAALAKLKLDQDEIQRERAETRKIQKAAAEEREAYLFMQNHPEYNRCEANARILFGELYNHKDEMGNPAPLELTANNLEIAYAAVESQLAPRIREVEAPVARVEPKPEPVAVKEEVKPEPVVVPAPAPVAAEPTPAPVAEPVAEPVEVVAEPVAAAPVAAPAAPVRKAPVGGIEPGSLRGTRPQVVAKTRADYLKMSKDEFKAFLRTPGAKEKLAAVGIPWK